MASAKKATEEKKETVKKVVAKKAVTKKAEVKKATVKKVEAKVAEVKPVEVIKADVEKKTEVKKVAAKKPKVVEAASEKVATKVETPKKVVKKATKEATKVETPKKVVKKATKEATATKVVAKKESAKKVAKPVAKKATKKVEASINYDHKSLEECIYIMQQLGVAYDYHAYADILLNEEDMKAIADNIIAGNDLDKKIKEAKIDEYDLGLVMATLNKVVETMPIAAVQFKDIKKAVTAAIKVTLGDDEEKNAKHYLDTFTLAEKVLMIGQRRNYTTSKQMKAVLKIDIVKFYEYFFTLARNVLATWQYEDVEYYQQFAFAVLAQFEDLYNEYQNPVQIDCADLFILQGDEGRGDSEYGYVLRENEIKDYIYYRYANIYVKRNLDKAKAIANSAFQYVDERYEYYPKLVDIVNM